MKKQAAIAREFHRRPLDPGIIPGGIRDRAMRAAMQRGPQPEDKEKTLASREFWVALKEKTSNPKLTTETGGSPMTEAYPLQWPEGWPRTAPYARESDRRFHDKHCTRDQLMAELRLLGATEVVVSSNVPTRPDGLLYSDPRRLDDPGIAVYFTYKKKKYVMARDRFVSVAVEGMHQVQRHGGDLMLERAFTGFLAIAPPDWKKPWREVFGIKADWTGNITELYREKARMRHPNAGGSDTLMAELNVAYEEARRELG
jgi:hypothetical protein